jgi:hypothetical protein
MEVKFLNHKWIEINEKAANMTTSCIKITELKTLGKVLYKNEM